MVSVTIASLGLEEGTGFISDVFSIMLNPDPTISQGQSQVTITAAPNQPGDNFSVVLSGTNLQSGGTVTDISFDHNGETDFSISGLSISAAAMQAAIQESDENPQKGEDIAALFKGIGWTVDLSASTVGDVLSGTGGDDNFSTGSGEDWLFLDGGTDTDNTGAGDDIIFAFPQVIVYGVADGLSKIDGGGGSDTFSLDFRDDGSGIIDDVLGTGETVDLDKDFVLKTIGGNPIFEFTSVENLRGSQYEDKLLGDGGANTLSGEEGADVLSGRGGKDIVLGGDGNDKLTGGGLADQMTGGDGQDVFIYTAVSDSAAKHDVITDFQHKADKIDLSKLHPDTGDDKFAFIGDHKFGHHAGELHVVEHDNNGTANDFTMVQADLDGNGKPDLQIELSHLVHLDKGDFIL